MGLFCLLYLLPITNISIVTILFTVTLHPIVDSQVKFIINKHFEDNYNYYKWVCNRYFNGRYLAEDMLHETYLKFFDQREDKIRNYNDLGKLRVLGVYFIRELFSCKSQTMKHKDGRTSPLHETSSNEFDFERYYNDDKDCEMLDAEVCQEDKREEVDLIKLERIKEEIVVSIQNDDHDMNVFVMAQTQSINKISKETNINRRSIQHSYDRAQIRLKRLIQ